MPQVPQLAGSVVRSTHCPLHSVPDWQRALMSAGDWARSGGQSDNNTMQTQPTQTPHQPGPAPSGVQAVPLVQVHKSGPEEGSGDELLHAAPRSESSNPTHNGRMAAMMRPRGRGGQRAGGLSGAPRGQLLGRQ
jgi:hypothetical protein